MRFDAYVETEGEKILNGDIALMRFVEALKDNRGVFSYYVKIVTRARNIAQQGINSGHNHVEILEEEERRPDRSDCIHPGIDLRLWLVCPTFSCRTK